jgi:C-terminal peptidase prc
MKTLYQILPLALLFPLHMVIADTDELTQWEKEIAKKKIIEMYYKELPDSIKSLPFDSLRKHTDRFTFLIPNVIRERFMNPQKTDYARLGYGYNTNDIQRITYVVYEGDAYSSGLVKDQCILAINGRTPSTEDEWDLITDADSGDVLTYTLYDEKSDSTYNLLLTKNYIEEEDLFAEKLGRTAIIKFEDFMNNVHYRFRRASQRLVPETIDTLIVDLRNNGGGYVSEFDYIASEFVDKRTPLNRFVYRNHSDTSYTYQQNYGIWTHLKKIYIIINHKSASASEMLSGFLSKLDKTEIIGQKSYGKGRQQTVWPVSANSTLHVTNAEFFPSLTVKVDGVGIIPKRPLKKLADKNLLSVKDIIQLRQEYTVPSEEAFKDERILGNESQAPYIWDVRGELFMILYKELYK